MINKIIFILSINVLIINLIHGQQKYVLNQYNGLSTHASISDIILGDGVSAYVATSEGIFYVPSVSVEARNIVPGRNIKAMSENVKNNFYFGGDNIFSSTISPNNKISIGDKTVDISCLGKVKDELWVGTNNGIYVINTKTNKITKHFNTANSKLSSNQINWIHNDEYDVVWVGTKNGLARIQDDKWDVYEKNKSFESVFENLEGLWVLSDKELWNIDNIQQANRWYKLNLKKDLKKGHVNDLVIDSHGKLVIASDILVRFDPYNDEIDKYGNDLGLVSQKCTALAIDQEDRIWIGTNDNGLFTVGFKEHLPSPREKIPMEISLITKSPSCYEDNDGSIKLLIKGGSKNQKIRWSTGETDVKSLENLTAGEYRVTVVDSKKDSISKVVVLSDPKELKLTIGDMVKNPTDTRSSASFKIDGGTPGYRFVVDNINSDNPAINLFPGDHTATVTDVFGCTATAQFNIEGEINFSDLNVKDIKVGQVIQIENLYFSADSVEVSNSSKPVLDEIYSFLNANKNIVVEIGGHTNNIPPDEYCDKLSTERAKNIADYLIIRGIEPKRIDYKGYGKRFPIASNDTAAGRKKNQRVELKVLSVDN